MKIIIEKIKQGLKFQVRSLLHLKWWLSTQYSHPIVPVNCRQSVWGSESVACCQRQDINFPIPATVIYQKWRFSWHGKQCWPHSEMAAKARAITGWTSHTQKCSVASLASYVSWLWELIQPKSGRGRRQSFLHAPSKSWCRRRNKQNYTQQEEKEVGMALWKWQRIWGSSGWFGFEILALLILIVCQLLNIYEPVSSADKLNLS